MIFEKFEKNLKNQKLEKTFYLRVWKNIEKYEEEDVARRIPVGSNLPHIFPNVPYPVGERPHVEERRHRGRDRAEVVRHRAREAAEHHAVEDREDVDDQDEEEKNGAWAVYEDKPRLDGDGG